MGEANQFTTTRWELVKMTCGDGETASQALNRLCEIYWPPLYCFLRKSGHSPEEAQDLTQGFFASLISRETFQSVEPEHGKLRSYLIQGLKNFVADQWHHKNRQKRAPLGGFVSFETNPEVDFSQTVQHSPTPERAFDRRWALLVLDNAMAKLSAEYAQRGRVDLCQRLQAYLLDDPDATIHQVTADALGMTESAVKCELNRMRRRLRELIRDEIRSTVADDSQIDMEFVSLTSALQS